ncbi:Uncharacterised protein [BD1-7 clade bacterium]|uniref:Uncharacterized protein n=1 Tax=BD1-7 clade bacterium TaxID=2029982 RepID=A0A5S9QYI4_9GAMM|nr:Uncharacterised protein [BD1-7 clade bacterium]
MRKLLIPSLLFCLFVITTKSVLADQRSHIAIGEIVHARISDSLIRFLAETTAESRLSEINGNVITVENAEGDALANVGKTGHFRLENRDGETFVIATQIRSAVYIGLFRNKAYVIAVPIEVHGVRKFILAIIRDRRDEETPVLLGRNFLHGHYLRGINH